MNNLLKNLSLIWSRLQGRLLSLAPGGVWLSAAAMAAVLAWGFVDPFGIRQRLDWMATDQLLRSRSAPPVHEGLLQISIDDRAAQQLGFPVPRYKLARVLRQLQALGARTILIDVLFTEPHDQPALDEARRWLVPVKNVVDEARTELGEWFIEDRVLARAMDQAERLVIPFKLEHPENAPANEHLTRQLTEIILADPAITPGRAAEKLQANLETVSRRFDWALQAALDRLAHRWLESNPSVEDRDALTAALPQADSNTYLSDGFVLALNRARSNRLLRQKAARTIEPHERKQVSITDDPEMPRHILVAAADSLGFLNAELDSDGTLRRLPLVARWDDRLVFHQALVAVLRHRDLNAADVRLEARSLRAGDSSLQIPIDSTGRLVIDWPMNRRRDWIAAIPQLSIADISKLDGYEYDVTFARHELRKCIAGLDNNAENGVGLALKFTEIQSALDDGRIEDVGNLERDFDEAIKEVFKLPDVSKEIRAARDRRDATAQTDGDGPLPQWAQALVRIQEQLPSLEQEHQAAFAALRSRVNGKLCLIGDTTTASVDLKETPVGAAVPGISVNLAAVNTMLTGKSLHPAGFAASSALMGSLCGLLVWLLHRVSAFPAGCSAIVWLLGVLFGSFLLVEFVSIVISPVTPIIGIVATYSTVTTFQWWHELQQKKLVRMIFETQTNPTIVETLLRAGAHGVEEVLTPKKRQVTVLFAEIAGYNDLAEQLNLERIATVLSRVFGTMAKIILARDGTLDRYEGHAMMAFFGAPVYQPDHAERACLAAIECRDAVAQLADDANLADLPALHVHFGIHTGELLVGNITLTSRIDYSVAGDNLSVAYRIADLNDTYGTEIMITAATHERCQSAVDARELDLVRIKGRREPVRAFELIGRKGKTPHEQATLIGTFLTGLTAFRNRDFAAALAMFQACRQNLPADQATVVYINRCEREIAAQSQTFTTSPTEN